MQNKIPAQYYKLLSIITLFLMGIAIYSNTFGNSFHFDDLSFILDNPTITTLGLTDIFKYWPTRFIGFFSLALNYQIHQFRLFGYHLVNIVLHILTASFVFWFMSLTFSTAPVKREGIYRHKEIISFFVAAIFLTHPVQTESLNYIFQRVTILAALFYLATICFYIKAMLASDNNSGINKYYYFAGLVTGFMGMFTKENMVTLPLMILIYDFYFLRRGKGINWKHVLPFFILLPLIPLTVWIARPIVFGDVSRLLSDPLAASIRYLYTQPRVLITYLRLFLLPVNQNLDYDYPMAQTFMEIPVLASFLSLVFIFIAGIKAFPRYRLLSFGIFWFFLALMPESSIIPILDLIYEHRLYLPLVGCSITGVSIVYYSFRNKKFKVTVIILSLMVALCSLSTYHRNHVWKDEISLWNDVVSKSPKKLRPYNQRGLAYFDKGEYDKALTDFTRAIGLNQDYADGYYNRGLVYQNKGAYDKAILDYTEAIRINPTYLKAYINRGQVYNLKEEHEKASIDFKSAMEIDPFDKNAYYNLAYVYSSLGKKEEAVALYKGILKIDPSDAEAYYNLGIIRSNIGEKKEAVEMLKKAIELNPRYAPAFNTLAYFYVTAGDKEQLIELYKKAIASKLNYFDAYYYLGNLCRDAGKFRDSIPFYQKAITINPRSAEACLELGSAYCAIGNNKKAIRLFQRAIDLDPNIAVAYNNLAVAYYYTNQFDLAIKYCDKAIELGYGVLPSFLDLIRPHRKDKNTHM
jgi:tetratricopeptide (TPR) repeat protein